MSEFPCRPLYGVLGPRLPEAYCLERKTGQPIYVLGPYAVSTGGADMIQPYHLTLALIRKYANLGHVVFEGVLISTSYGSIGELLEEWGKDAVWVFLTTPLEKCVEGVLARRKARGDARLFDPEKLAYKFKQNLVVREKVLAGGKMKVVDASANEAAPFILDVIEEREG